MDSSLFHGSLVTTSRIIYTPSTFARENLLYLQETGELQAKKPHTSKRENLTSYLFFIVLRGSGTLLYEGKTFSLSSGDCIFLDCSKPYAHSTSNALWTLKWVHFYGSSMHNIYENYLESGGQPCFHSDRLEEYKEILDSVFSTASSTIYAKDMKICEKLTALLALLMEEIQNPELKGIRFSNRRDLHEVREYLGQHFSEKISLEHLSDQFFINKFYLTRLFKEQFGVSVNSYLLQARITHAKQLLRFTNLSIEEIGQKCGMNDANYFSRMFKKTEGITPGEYRRKW